MGDGSEAFPRIGGRWSGRRGAGHEKTSRVVPSGNTRKSRTPAPVRDSQPPMRPENSEQGVSDPTQSCMVTGPGAQGWVKAHSENHCGVLGIKGEPNW